MPLPHLATVERAGLSFETDEGTSACCGTRFAFFGRRGGVSEPPYDTLNIDINVPDSRRCADENRRRALAALGAEPHSANLLAPRQVHSSKIAVVHDAGHLPLELISSGADGICCLADDVPVLLGFADCVPVVLIAPGGGFAVVHAGWRGTFAGIAGKAARMLARTVGCGASQVNAYIGPHIGACCYEVSEDLMGRFTARYGKACDAGNRHLSLTDALRVNLGEAGVAPERIACSTHCTSCEVDVLFSYRAQDGLCGRQGAMAYHPALFHC